MFKKRRRDGKYHPQKYFFQEICTILHLLAADGLETIVLFTWRSPKTLRAGRKIMTDIY
jgi:hypothetical protein